MAEAVAYEIDIGRILRDYSDRNIAACAAGIYQRTGGHGCFGLLFYGHVGDLRDGAYKIRYLYTLDVIRAACYIAIDSDRRAGIYDGCHLGHGCCQEKNQSESAFFDAEFYLRAPDWRNCADDEIYNSGDVYH